MKSKPKSRQANIVVQELENEFLIYDLKINKAFCLNETSTLVYQLCDGTKTVAEISNLMSRKLNTLISEDFVWLALNELKKENLLEDRDELEINFGGLNRREVVKKVGLASMIGLPVIASVVAPTALMAQSGLLPLFAACSTSPQCASGNCYPSGAFGVVCCSSTTNNLGLSQSNPFCAVSCAVSGPTTCCSGVSDGGLGGNNGCPVGQLLCMCVDS